MSLSFFTGFEIGDSSELTSLGTGGSITSGGTAGAYVLHGDGGSTSTRSTKTLASSITRARVSIRINIASTTPSTNWNTDIHVYDGSGNDLGGAILFFIGPTANDWFIFINGRAVSPQFTQVSSGAFTMTTGWHLLEWDYPTAISSVTQVWWDGVSKGTSGAYSAGIANIAEVRFGAGFGTGAGTDVVDVDDLIIDDANQPGDCRVIARQIKSGTPTYDAFTKSSGTIDTVWSDTPFSASSYARSAVSAAAQTGLLSSFSSTQSGHGSGTIGGSDTLKAIQATLVAKTAATTASGITTVGTNQAGQTTNGGNVTLTFSSAPLAGDVVIVTGGHILRTGTSYGPSTSGYTAIGSLQTSGASGTGIAFGAWYKVMGDTPDTSVVLFGSGTNGDGCSYSSTVLRQVDNSVVLDVTAVFGGPTTSTNPDPPAITPTNNNCAIVIAAGSLVSDTNIGSATNYSNQATANSAATRPYSGSLLSRVLSGGGGASENPPAIGSTGNAWASGLWFSVSIAVRPATAAGSAASIRARLASTDTDTAVTLTTSDALYNVASSTVPTLTDLNAGELGLLHGNSSIQQTVEDVWMHVAYIPSGAQEHSVAATFAGTGALTASPVVVKALAANFAGAGALTGTLRIPQNVLASFAGAGALTANPASVKSVSATFAGVGALTANIVKFVNVDAAFVGAGGLTASLNLNERISAAFAGAGSLTADITAVTAHFVEATFAGAGNLTATINLGQLVSSTFQGSGSLAATLRLNMGVAAQFAGTGALTTTPYVLKSLSATFTGEGALGATLRLNMGVSALFGGAGALTGDVNSLKNLAATFAGAGNLGVSLNLNMAVRATFGGAGALSAEITVPGVVNNWQVEAAFSGAGALTANLRQNMGVLANFAGAGNLTANPRQNLGVAASFQGAGALTDVALRLNMAVRAAFQGAGLLSAVLESRKNVAASFAGAGGLTAFLNLRMLLNATFAGAGNLTANIIAQSPSNVHMVEANFIGAGALAATLRQGMVVTASFGGAGTLTANLRQNMRVSSEFAGSGELSAHVRMNQLVRGTFAGLGELASDIVVPVAGGHQIEAQFAGSGSLSADLTIIEGSRLPTTGYESQIGVWHPHGGRTGRTGKRYRIYTTPDS